MTYRAVPVAGKELEQLLRDVLDRLQKLEGGSALAGTVSVGVLRIGDVTVEVVPAVGLHRDVVFTNLLSGATDTIHL